MAVYTSVCFDNNENEFVEVDLKIEGEWVPYCSATRYQPEEGGYAEDVNFLFEDDFTFMGTEYHAGESLYAFPELYPYMDETIESLEDRAQDMIEEDIEAEREYAEEMRYESMREDDFADSRDWAEC